MPELPEVETIRRDLAPRVVGRRVSGFRVLRGAGRILLGVPQRRVRDRLVGRRIAGVDRRGKYLLFRLDDGRLWIVHLGMTGSLRHRPAAAEPDPFLRALVTLDDGTELRYIDIRKFGVLRVVDRSEEAVENLGPEPLDPAFTVEALWAALRGRKAPLKAALLDQRNLAGVGNIYADEALFLAHLHPAVPAGSLRPAERAALHAAVQRVLRDGIANRGASFRDYTDADGRKGAQQYYVRVFRRTDQPCDACGAPIRRSLVGGRASHWCPRCQPPRQTARKVQTRQQVRRKVSAARQVARRG